MDKASGDIIFLAQYEIGGRKHAVMCRKGGEGAMEYPSPDAAPDGGPDVAPAIFKFAPEGEEGDVVVEIATAPTTAGAAHIIVCRRFAERPHGFPLLHCEMRRLLGRASMRLCAFEMEVLACDEERGLLLRGPFADNPISL